MLILCIAYSLRFVLMNAYTLWVSYVHWNALGVNTLMVCIWVVISKKKKTRGRALIPLPSFHSYTRMSSSNDCLNMYWIKNLGVYMLWSIHILCVTLIVFFAKHYIDSVWKWFRFGRNRYRWLSNYYVWQRLMYA